LYFREFIENKEKNVEKFYNEDSNQNEDNTNLLFSNNNVQDKKTISIDVDEGNSCDEGLNFKIINICLGIIFFIYINIHCRYKTRLTI